MQFIELHRYQIVVDTLECQTTHCIQNEFKTTSPPGFEPGTFRLTAERANRLRHGGLCFLEDVIITSQDAT